MCIFQPAAQYYTHTTGRHSHSLFYIYLISALEIKLCAVGDFIYIELTDTKYRLRQLFETDNCLG